MTSARYGQVVRILGSLAVVASLLFAACDYLNTRETGYATIADAREAGAIAAGFVPDHLPASAREIRERHTTDGREVWGRFEFSEPDRELVGSACRPANPGHVPMPGSETRATGWWAEMLRSDAATAAEHFSMYECGAAPDPPGRRFLAVHRRLTTAFFWTTAKRD